MSSRLPAAFALGTAAALALTSCATAPAPDDGSLQIVASTAVYGDLAAAIAGDAAEVTSIITGVTQDPHSYEATARDRLAIESADLVIANGGGYDAFVDTILDATATPPATVVATVVLGLEEGEAHDDEHPEESSHDDEADEHGHLEGVNEHLWYDLHAMIDVVHEIAHELGALDPANAEQFEAAAEALAAELEALDERAHELGESYAAEAPRAIVTEPVPLALLELAGIADATPAGFAEAVEEGSEISPALLADTLALLEEGGIALLAYNAQTAGPETERIRAAAEAAGVPIVDLTELLPEGTDYLSWMSANLDALESALAAGAA